MTQSEAIAILLNHASSEEITQYMADTMKLGDNYFKNFNKEALLADFNARKLSA